MGRFPCGSRFKKQQKAAPRKIARGGFIMFGPVHALGLALIDVPAAAVDRHDAGEILDLEAVDRLA